MYHFLQVSTTSSKTNLSKSSNKKSVDLGLSQVFPYETPSLANKSNTVSMERLEFPLSGTFDLSETQSKITNQCSSPQDKDDKLLFPKHSEDSGLAKTSSVTPDSVCQTAQDSPDDQIAVSSESSPTPQGSGSPQLDQLLSDLEEMKHRFRPETLDLRPSESSDGSTEADQMYKFEDLSPEDGCPSEHSNTIMVSVSSVIQLADDTNCTNAAVTEPAQFQTSIQDEPELVSGTPDLSRTSETSALSSQGRHKDSPIFLTESFSIPDCPQGFDKVMKPSLNSGFSSDIFQSNKYDENPTETCSVEFYPKVIVKAQSGIPEKNLCEEDSTTDIPQNQEEHELIKSSNDSKIVAEQISTQSIPDQLPHLWEETYVEPEDSSSQSPPESTRETVTTARHFSLEQLIPYPSTGNVETFLDEDRPTISGQNSEKSLTPLDYEYFASQSTSVNHKAEITSSTSDEEYSIPPAYSECLSTTSVYTHMPRVYTDVLHSGTDSPAFEYSDPESYFDCKQAASDFSETDEPETRTTSVGDQPQDRLGHPRVLENQRVLLSSGSEDYEDDTFACEPLHNIHEKTKELQHYSETSDEEFTLCEASRPPPVYKFRANDDTDKSLTRVRWGLINHPNLQAIPKPELNQILYLLQRGMTANPLVTWMGSKYPYNPSFVFDFK